MTERRTKRSSTAVEEPQDATGDSMTDATMKDATIEASVAAAPPTEAQPTAAADEPTAEAEPVAGGPIAEPESPPASGGPIAEPDAAPEPRPEAPAEPEPPAAAAAEPEAAPERKPGRGKPKAEAEAVAPAGPRATGPRGLRARYLSDVVPALIRQFEYANPNMVPKVDKIVVNIGIGEALTNAKAIDAASGDLTMITGQKPIVMKARRSIAQFKIRTGNPIGLKVTLRGQRMWDFLERLTLLALPRIRDFRGTPSRSFDGRGNYTLGLREQIAFPEIDYDKVDRLRGLEVSIVTTAKSDEESKRLLELLGMPFAA
jgi:large subunit ribosomal protein L5